MKLKDLLRVIATGQDVIVRLMHPTDNKDFDYDMEFNFVHYRVENSNVICNESERKKLTDVLNILLKMNVKKFYSDIDFGKTEWDDYAPIGDYDIQDRIIIELEPITSDNFAKIIPKKYLFKCAHYGYVTDFTVYKDVMLIQVKTKLLTFS